MVYTLLRNQLKVSRIAMGCWGISPIDFTWGGTEKATALKTLYTAYDLGINFFDTAEMYGDGGSESLLGCIWDTIPRDQVTIASKVSQAHLNSRDLIQACENSLRRLKSDYIDLYQIHWPNPNIPLEETLKGIETLIRDGKIRYMGLSNFGVSYLKEFEQIGKIDLPLSNQLNYSLLFRAIEYQLLPTCQRYGLPILCYSPLAQGLLSGKIRNLSEVPVTRARTRLFAPHRPYSRHHGPNLELLLQETLHHLLTLSEEVGIPLGKLALSWILSQQGIASVIVGFRSPEHVHALLPLVEDPLSDCILHQLQTITLPLKVALGDNCDIWEDHSRLERPSHLS
ncbi:MAG: aldo/keto reductase [Candidatus Bathyarchaeia archaeon]